MSALATAQYVRFGHYGGMAKSKIAAAPNRIRELRKARGWSLAVLGAKCIPTMTATQIDKREKGITAVTIEDMQRIAQALECHPAELLPLPPINTEEQALVGLYRGLAEPDRRAVFRVADALAKSPGEDNGKTRRRG